MKFDKRKIREQLEIGHRVDDILEKAVHENQPNDTVHEAFGWQRVLLNLALLGGYIALAAGVIVWNMEEIVGLSGNDGAQLIVRSLGLVLLTVIYIRLRTVLHQSLFPTVDREVVRTIYKIAPELIQDGFTQEASDIKLNKNAVRTWVLVFGFSVLLVIGALINPRFLSSAIGIATDEGIGGTVIRIILIAFGIGIWTAIKLLLTVHREYDHLGEMVWRIQHLGKNIHGADVLKKAIPTDRASIIAEKLRAIMRIWQMKKNIVPADLREHAFSHFRLTRQMPHFIAAAMPILGLVGTILGLTVSIGGFEDVLSTDITDRAHFASSIGVSVGGISTAFYTTLAGTISMLILKVFTLISSNVYSNFLVDMRNVIAVEVLPRLREHADEDQLPPQKPNPPTAPPPPKTPTQSFIAKGCMTPKHDV